jgi:hypothetical protein
MRVFRAPLAVTLGPWLANVTLTALFAVNVAFVARNGALRPWPLASTACGVARRSSRAILAEERIGLDIPHNGLEIEFLSRRSRHRRTRSSNRAPPIGEGHLRAAG